VFDSKRGTILLLGGQAGVNPTVFFNDIWEYDSAAGTWRELQPSGAQYPAFGCADKCSAAYDEGRDRLVLVNYGGTWEWDRSSWTRKGGAPNSANVMTLHFDRRSGKTIGLGDDGAISMRIMEWDGDSWRFGASENTAPAFRHRTAAAFDDARRRLVLFGGSTNNPKYPAEGNPSIYWDDVWEWDASSGAWSEIKPAGSKPPPAEGHAMAYDRNRGGVLLFYAVAVPDQAFVPALSEVWRYMVSNLDSGAVCAPELATRCASGRCLGRCCASACSDPMACNPQGQCVPVVADAGASPDAPADTATDAAPVSDVGPGVPAAPDSPTDSGFATDAAEQPRGPDGGGDQRGELSDGDAAGTDAAADLASLGPDGPAGREKPDALADTGSFVQNRAPLYQGPSCSVWSRGTTEPLPLAVVVIAAWWALTFAACRGRRRRGGVTDQTGTGARPPSVGAGQALSLAETHSAYTERIRRKHR
jgi:hypothetical protein